MVKGDKSEAVVVSTKRGRFPFSRRINNANSEFQLKRRIIIASSVFVALVVVWMFMPKVTVGDIKLSNFRYQVMKQQSKSAKVKSSDFQGQLIFSLKKIAAAKKLNIEVKNSDVATILGKQGISRPNSWQTLIGQTSVIDNQILFYQKGGYKGTIFYFPFSQHFYATMFPQQAPFGDAKTIADDKTYALNTAKEYRDKIVAGTINIDQALREIRQDDRLIMGPTSNLSKSFSVDEYGLQARNGSQVQDSYMTKHLDDLKVMKAGDISPIKVQKTLIPYDTKGNINKANTEAEVQYYFIKLDAKPAKRENIVRDFNKALTEMKVSK